MVAALKASQHYQSRGQYCQNWLHSRKSTTLPKALQAIQEADYIIIGPGSLYTSVIPDLLVPEMRKRSQRCVGNGNSACTYVCNIMTQPGETQGYTVSDHIKSN